MSVFKFVPQYIILLNRQGLYMSPKTMGILETS